MTSGDTMTSRKSVNAMDLKAPLGNTKETGSFVVLSGGYYVFCKSPPIRFVSACKRKLTVRCRNSSARLHGACAGTLPHPEDAEQTSSGMRLASPSRILCRPERGAYMVSRPCWATVPHKIQTRRTRQGVTKSSRRNL